MRLDTVILAILSAACLPSQASETDNGAIATSLPLVRVSPPTSEEGWSCANWSQDTWHVEQTDSGPLARPVQANDDDLRIAVPGGELRGYNNGEFGGYLTYRASGSAVEDSLLEDNPIALIPYGPNVLMVAGLGHLGLRRGHVVLLTRGPGLTWMARELVDLGTAPQAATRVNADTLLIATSEGVLGVHLSEGTVYEAFRNEEWFQLYATSLLRTRTGRLYVGMRRAVAVLEPIGGRYGESWLVRATCPTLHRTDRFSPCSCS